MFLLFGGDGRNVLSRRSQDRFDDIVVTCAAADVAFQIIAHFCLCRLGIYFQQFGCSHHHARFAEPALKTAVGLERLLNYIK